MATTTMPEKQQTQQMEERPARRGPFWLFDELQDEMGRLWDRAMPLVPRVFGKPFYRLEGHAFDWAPRMDVFRKDGDLVLKAELPGMEKKETG